MKIFYTSIYFDRLEDRIILKVYTDLHNKNLN